MSRRIYNTSSLTLQALIRRTSCRRFSRTTIARSNPYPYPTTSNPTPYQIFHLLPDSSPAEVKQRYYELVRLYHPDSAVSKKSQPDPALRHAQFSAITKAYETMQKRPANGEVLPDENAGPNPWRRTPHVNRRVYHEETFIDDRWKEKLIWAGLCFTLITVSAQYIAMRHTSIKDVSSHIRESALHREDPAVGSRKPPENKSDWGV